MILLDTDVMIDVLRKLHQGRFDVGAVLDVDIRTGAILDQAQCVAAIQARACRAGICPARLCPKSGHFFAAIGPQAIAVSTITLAELHHGASSSARANENHAAIDDCVSALTVIDVTPSVARRFGKIKATLRAPSRCLAWMQTVPSHLRWSMAY